MGTLAKRLDTVEHTPTVKGCNTCAWLATVDEDDRRAFYAWIDDGLSLTELWRHCRDAGLDVSMSAFQRHRDGWIRGDHGRA